MATDATGTPTALGIPKYNTSSDPPSGKGFNAAMDAIDALITARLAAASVTTAGTALLSTKLLTGDTQPAFRIFGDGTVQWGPGGSTTPDTNLYRAGADVLYTDDVFGSAAGIYSIGDITGRNGTAQKVSIGYVGGSAGIVFGSTGDTNLFRMAADYLGTQDTFAAHAFNVVPQDAGDSWAYTASFQGDGQPRFIIGRAGQLSWGNGTAAADTTLYRSAADFLATDDSFIVASNLYVDNGAGGNKVYFGSAQDTNLYRDAANSLKTDDDFAAVLDITARRSAAGQTIIGRRGPSNEAGIAFGDSTTGAVDIALYRAAGPSLRTEGNLITLGTFNSAWNGSAWMLTATTTGLDIVGNLTVSGSITAGSGLNRMLNYTEKTSNTTISSSTEATPTTIITAGAVTFDGTTPVMIQFFTPRVQLPNANLNSEVTFLLWDDTANASIGRIGHYQMQSGQGVNDLSTPGSMWRRLTPAAGSRTYSIRAFWTGTTGTVIVGGAGGASTFVPTYIRIMKDN